MDDSELFDMFCAPLSGVGEQCFDDLSCEPDLYCFFDTCFEYEEPSIPQLIDLNEEIGISIFGDVLKSAAIVLEGDGIFGEAEFLQYADGTRMKG